MYIFGISGKNFSSVCVLRGASKTLIKIDDNRNHGTFYAAARSVDLQQGNVAAAYGFPGRVFPLIHHRFFLYAFSRLRESANNFYQNHSSSTAKQTIRYDRRMSGPLLDGRGAYRSPSANMTAEISIINVKTSHWVTLQKTLLKGCTHTYRSADFVARAAGRGGNSYFSSGTSQSSRDCPRFLSTVTGTQSLNSGRNISCTSCHSRQVATAADGVLATPPTAALVATPKQREFVGICHHSKLTYC